MTGPDSGVSTSAGRPAIAPAAPVVVLLGADYAAPAAVTAARAATTPPPPLLIDTAVRGAA